MLVFELKQRLHFAIHEIEDEELLKAMLSLAGSSLAQDEQTSEELRQTQKQKGTVRILVKTTQSSDGRFSLKDRYYFEDKAF